MIFDSHAHYDDAQFDVDRASLLSSELPKKGVCAIMNASASYESLADVIRLTEEYPYVYGAVGIHPECAAALPENWLPRIRELAGNKKIRAIGEIGLDYHWLDECPKDRQRAVFIEQLELAAKLNLPVLIHDREAHGDTLELLKQYRPAGVLHCFSGSSEMAGEIIALGMYIGVGGVVTFKNAKRLTEIVRELPLDRILLETDAPYMAPEPFRGKRNDSSLISFVAEKIAELRGIDSLEVLSATEANARRLFGLDAGGAGNVV